MYIAYKNNMCFTFKYSITYSLMNMKNLIYRVHVLLGVNHVR